MGIEHFYQHSRRRRREWLLLVELGNLEWHRSWHRPVPRVSFALGGVEIPPAKLAPRSGTGDASEILWPPKTSVQPALGVPSDDAALPGAWKLHCLGARAMSPRE